MDCSENATMESPEYVRLSLAAAMTLGFKSGLFYRDAQLHCMNLLLTYESGCAACCAYCGLAGRGKTDDRGKRFIRVQWPAYHLDRIIDAISESREAVKRVCISMITRNRAAKDTKDICAHVRSQLDIPVSLLVSPTVLGPNDLLDFRRAGADKIGVAIDLATPLLFDKYRGSGVKGPHQWEIYWDCLSRAIDIFGKDNAGVHLMVGMGETEKEMCATIQKVSDMGGRTHLFSFFPESNSMMADHRRPALPRYRRIQLARHIIDAGYGHEEEFSYHDNGRIRDLGLTQKACSEIIDSGEPFQTSGCEGEDGQVACNRPFANSRPGPHLRNYPFAPSDEDMDLIRRQIGF
ncbi:MAG: radical SAM protein [Desulfobacterales bacterium]